jgi:hypothetical protein
MADLGAQANALLPYVNTALNLSNSEAKRLSERLWAFSGWVRQPRKDDRSCNKTPFFDRWDLNPNTSHLTLSDPRYASRQTCEKVCATLAALLLEARAIPQPPPEGISLIEQTLGRPFQPHSLACVHTGQAISGDDIKRALNNTTQRLGTYEIPTSYRVSLHAGGRHEHTNVGWMKPIHINYALRSALRADLAESGVPSNAIKKALDKIQMKAYCTDKVTMPPFFSNRDVRWATWPDSIQYAPHYQCAMVEMELMAELYEFANAPALDEGLVQSIEEARRRPISPGTRQCFVTGRILDYRDYVQAAANPRGGRSAYHVGHILPLTRGGRHTRENVAWTSGDGHRLQGNNNTLEEIEVKLVNAVEYHLKRDMAMAQPPQAFYNKVEKLWTLLNDIRDHLNKR